MNLLKKLIHISVACLFFVFAYLQLNDNDGFYWILLYVAVAFLPVLELFKIKYKLFNYFIFTFLLVLIIMNLNLYSQWIEAEKPAFIDYEPTSIKEVEGIREFLGICVSGFVSFIYVLLNYKR